MSVEITGKLIQKLNKQTGQGRGGEWIKQEFVIETQEQYPRKVCIAAWGERVPDIQKIEVGNLVKVSANIESREYNGRWYTDVKAWRITAQNADTNNNIPPEMPPMSDDYLLPDNNDDSNILPF